MSNVGSSELLLIILIAAVVIGPKNIKPFIHTVLKGIRGFRKTINEFEKEFEVIDEFNEIKEVLADVSKDLTMKNEMNAIKKEFNEINKSVGKK